MTASFIKSDEELARECQAGAVSVFEELVSRYENRIYAYGVQSLRNHADAADLTQETFLRAFQAINQFDGKHSFAGWLFAIARRKCIDRYRSRRPEFESEAQQVDESDPARLLETREAGEALWSLARHRLSDLQFQVLWLRYAEDMDVREIARALRKSRVHVKVLLFRARQALAPHLAPVDSNPARKTGVEGQREPLLKVPRTAQAPAAWPQAGRKSVEAVGGKL